MGRWSIIIAALVAASLSSRVACATGGPGGKDGKLALKAGKVLTMDLKDTVLNNVVVFVRDGKIEKIVPQREAKIPDDYEVQDHGDHWLLPGFIDCHNHTATERGRDINDSVWLTNPGLRVGDLIETDSPNNRRAIAGGVTTALLIPGSASNLSGFGGLARLGGRTPEESVMKSPASLKIAQAGNPERWFFGVGRSYMNYNLRQTLRKAKDYHDRWTEFEKTGKNKPEFDATWDDFRELFRGNIPATVHTQMFQVVSKTMTMLHDEFGVKTVIDHGTFDSYKAAQLAIDRGLYAIVGPRVWWMDENDRTVNSCAGRWYQRGLKTVGLNTDAGVLPQEDLPMQGSMSVHYGWDTYPALVGLTRRAAEAVGVEDEIGVIKPGMSADMVAWTGDPLDFRSGVEKVYVLGFVAYDAAKGRRY